MKRNIVISMFCYSVLVVSIGAGSVANVDSGLVGYWSFDENNGNIVHDYSGSNNDGTIYGATWIEGIFGSALFFDGTDDYVLCTSPGPLGNLPRTLALWAKTSSTDWGYAFTYGAHTPYGASYRTGFHFECQGVHHNASGGAATSFATVADNNWHFYVFVLPDIQDATVADMLVYQDTVLLSDICWSIRTYIVYNTATDNSINIGRYFYEPQSYHYNGILDEIRLYDRALSHEEIQELYDFPSGPTLATSQYPMFRYDLAHIGRSPYYGTVSNNIRWFFGTGDPVICSPIVDPDGIVYFVGGDNTLYAVNMDGTPKWSRPLSTTKSSPAIAIDSTIYVGDGYGTLHAFSYNGDSKWDYTVGGSIVSSPAIGPEGAIYFGSTDGTICAVHSNGILKWKYATSASVMSSPAISPDGVVYVGSNDHKLYAINLNGTEAWSLGTPGAFISSPAIDTSTGVIYVGNCNGKLYAINPDGTIRNTFTAGDTITSSPAVGMHGTIFFGSYDGKVYALDSDLNLKWSYQTGDKIESSPSIDIYGHVYIGSNDGNFYCFNGSDSTLIWSAITGDAIESSPAIAANSCVYVGSSDGRLYAFGPEIEIQEVEPTLQRGFFVSQSEPNPFSDGTLIQYQLPKSVNVHIVIYNLFGRRVRMLVNKEQKAGLHTAIWDGRDNAGRKVPSGPYFLRFEAGECTARRKLSLIK